MQDKRGGVPRAHNLMQMFRDVLNHYGLMDLGYSSLNYTWHDRRRGELIWQRLDRAIAKYEWLTKFPKGRVRHLNYFTSNHHLILLSLNVNGEHQKWRRKLFCFEAMRITNFGCRDIITKAWDCTPDGTPMFVATKKLKKCKRMLKAWSWDHFCNVQKNIKKTKDWLWRAKQESIRIGDYNEVAHLKAKLNSLYDKEENMWHQWSQIQWMQCGDYNTKFFHG